MKRYILVFISVILLVDIAQAHDFVVTINKQNIYFTILSESDRTAEVTYSGSITDSHQVKCKGDIEIPSKVKYNDVVYTIVGIGPKAFSGANNLTGVILPESVKKIGDFAFEGCSSLKNIVFPNNPIEFGQGVFFKCQQLQNISLGRNWKEVNLLLFQWSDSLSTIHIPVKVEKIRNLKALRSLKEIDVDKNNQNFSSVDGILYNKSKRIMYGCPRAYTAPVKIPEGTVEITKDAFIDCPFIESVDLPQTLTFISFREFSRMSNMKEVVFRSSEPVVNTKSSDANKSFLLQVNSQKIKVYVPKKSVKKYKKALVKAEDGEYCDKNGEKAYVVTKEQMLSPKNIIGVSKFDKK